MALERSECTRVVVTGLGAFCAAAPDVQGLWPALRDGRGGIRRVEAYEQLFDEPFAGVVGWEPPVDLRRSKLDPYVVMAVTAAREAWNHAGLAGSENTARCLVVVGTSGGTHADRGWGDHLNHEQHWDERPPGHHKLGAVHVARDLGLEGPRITISSACASGNLALASALEQLRSGAFDLALVGGADVVSRRRFAGFYALGVVAPHPMAPFSRPPGMNIGEGAGFLVLETAAHARARGASVLAELMGWGSSSDGYHATAPEPTGRGIARGLEAALVDAGVQPGDVGYYSAHATGTEANDTAEWSAVQRVFGPAPQGLRVSAPKSFFGHSFGAAGTLEAVVAVTCLQHGVVPPTLGFTEPRRHGPQDPVSGGRAEPWAWDLALSNNSAFGGANAALVMGKQGAARPRSRLARDVWLDGCAVVGAQGGRDLLEVLAEGETLAQSCEDLAGEAFLMATVAPERFYRELRGVDPRELDPPSTWLTVAAARALAGGGHRVRGALRDRAGLMLGISQRPVRADLAFRRSYDERGSRRALAPAFARTVMNASAGTASRALALRGPTAAFASGRGAGLVALVHAATVLRARDDADLMVVAGLDELDLRPPREARWRLPGAHPPCEGAASVVLSSKPGPIRLAGWALRGPEQLPDTILEAMAGAAVQWVFSAAAGLDERALEEAALAQALGDGRPGTTSSPASVLGYGDASTALAATAHAAAVLCSPGERALVLAHDRDVGSVAVVLEWVGCGDG